MSSTSFTAFTKAVLDDARKQKQEILQDVAHDKETLLESFEMEILKNMYDRIKRDTEAIRGEVAQEISKADYEARLALISKRDAIRDGVFAALREKLTAFISTPEYKEYLARKLLNTLSGIKGHAIIFVSPADVTDAETISSAIPGGSFTVQADDTIALGGYKVLCDSGTKRYDETLEKILESKHERFCEISGLTIEI